jgi:uncharacterized protein YqfA (UPF0365 family)
MPTSIDSWIILGIASAALLVGDWLAVTCGPAWVRARRAGVQVPAKDVLSMRLRGVDVRAVLGAAALLRRSAPEVPVSSIEVDHLAGGDVRAVAAALAHARAAGTPSSWESLSACDLAGLDVLAIARAGVDTRRVLGSKEFAGRFRKPGP